MSSPSGGFFRQPFFIRLFHWEYWPFSVVYVPIYFIWVGLCAIARSFFFFNAANPRIENGGFLNESKKDIAALVPESLQPKTIFCNPGVSPEIVWQQLEKKGMRFPMIGKPDVGGRGRGIEKLADRDALERYISRLTMPFHIQEFIDYPLETGIFYHRFPLHAKGNISGIVHKEFLVVEGDGRSTVRDLLKKNTRGILQLEALADEQPGLLDFIPAMHEQQVISPYGNHARGAKFLDDSARISPALIDSIDAICKQIPAFYFGRLDIRYASWEQLERGEALCIIEVNGAGSEPTHMYDPRHSLFFAWKEIIRHWIILWKISRQNHARGFRYLSLSEGIAMFRKNKAWSKLLDAKFSNP